MLGIKLKNCPQRIKKIKKNTGKAIKFLTSWVEEFEVSKFITFDVQHVRMVEKDICANAQLTINCMLHIM